MGTLAKKAMSLSKPTRYCKLGEELLKRMSDPDFDADDIGLIEGTLLDPTTGKPFNQTEVANLLVSEGIMEKISAATIGRHRANGSTDLKEVCTCPDKPWMENRS